LTNFDDIKPLLRAGAKDSFPLFCYWYDYEFFKARPFLKGIAAQMQRVSDGEIKNLAVSLPPRFGKSYITTLFCAWTLGRYPTESVMRNTCTATLSRKLSYDAREVLKSEKFAEIFPDVTLSDDKAAVDGWNTNKAKNVSYFGQGVGGTIIGFGASKVAITDDLFKSIEDAMSETIKDKAISWLHGTHESRMEKGCASIDIGTRWTRDDVIGTRSSEGFYDVEIIIPALNDNDESYCESVMSTAEYHAKRARTEESIWMAEYMQQPVDAKGRLFEGLKLSTETSESLVEKADGALAYIDVADDGSDYLCMVVGLLVGELIHVTDVIYTKANTDTTVPMCAELLNKRKVFECFVETNGMGALFVKMLKPLVSTARISAVKNSTQKQTRIIMHAGIILNNFRFMNNETADYGQYIRALKSYSKEGKNKNDDAPDATAGLAYAYVSRFKHLFFQG
jgi:predicted phage terminase large subunit-like protein